VQSDFNQKRFGIYTRNVAAAIAKPGSRLKQAEPIQLGDAYRSETGKLLACLLTADRGGAFSIKPPLNLAQNTAHALPFRIISPKQEIYLAAETEGGRIWQKQTW
jgi:hypothetical protein